MNPKMIWANLAVNDLERTTRFYTTLGFTANGLPSDEITSFVFGDQHFAINFILESKLRAEIKGGLSDTKQGNEVIFSLSAQNREQADRWAEEVEKAGGTLVSRPEEFGEGYYGFVFADPDGHKYNVFHMKGF